MKTGDRIGYSKMFFDVIPLRLLRKYAASQRRGKIIRVDHDLYSIQWDDGPITHVHKSHLQLEVLL